MDRYIQSYYEGDLDKGREILEELTSDVKHKDLYDTVLWNAKYYIRRCPGEKVKIFKPRIFTEKVEKEKKFAINPFIVQDTKTQQIIVGVRVTNAAANDGINPMIFQGKVRTKYEIYIYDKDLKTLIRHFGLTMNLPKLVDRVFFATGYEDFRAISSPDPDVLIGTCTGIESHQAGPVRMCRFHLRIQREGDEITGLVAENLVPLTGYGEDKQQKNWTLLPLNSGPGQIVYSTTPLILLQEDLKRPGYCVEKITVPNRFFNYRNGTPFVPFSFSEEKGKEETGEKEGTGEKDGLIKEGYLTISHTSMDHPKERRRIYYHRFFFFSKEFKLLQHSPLFFFEANNTVEFASDMIYHEDQRVFYIAFGFRDRVSYIHKITLTELLSFMHII